MIFANVVALNERLSRFNSSRNFDPTAIALNGNTSTLGAQDQIKVKRRNRMRKIVRDGD